MLLSNESKSYIFYLSLINSRLFDLVKLPKQEAINVYKTFQDNESCICITTQHYNCNYCLLSFRISYTAYV